MRKDRRMELQRSISDRLLAWKASSQGRSALLIEGARRVGKSTVAERFGREHYRSHVVIDFAKAPRIIRANFDDNLNDLDTFYQTIALEYGVEFYRRQSLVIFDEIQKFPKAREAVKYLVADGRYDILETGSLISIRENVGDIVIPSEEERIKMYPLSFEEFLQSQGEGGLCEHIKDCWRDRRPLDDHFHKKASRLFREYMLVGGMPQSVVAYSENDKSFSAADRAKRLILDLYRDDIRKAAKRYNMKVSALFEGIPGYLSTHEKKVVLSDVRKGATFDEYEDPLFWLDDSMICSLCYRCSDPNVGLALSRDDSSVKCYMGDTGLLVSHAFSELEIANDDLYRQIMNGRLSLNEGMLHENMVAQMLVARGRRPFFYTHYSEAAHRNDIEIDFLVSNESKVNYKVSPIEVKSSKNYTTVSHEKFKLRFGSRIGEAYVVHPKQLQAVEGGYRVPSYMAFCLFE